MKSYPVQGVGVCVDSLNWKELDVFCQEHDDSGNEFYAEVQPNGVRTVINLTIAGGDDDDNDAYFLVIYNCKPYEQTPFSSLEEIKEFYVRALRESVHNTDDEIRAAVEDIDTTYWG